MKKFTLPLILLGSLLAPCCTRAALIIYKGIEKEIVTGATNVLRPTWRVFVILDGDTGNYARIRYATVNDTKTYRTLTRTNSHIVQVIGSNGRSYTAITRIPTDCELQEFPGSESVYFRGPNASLIVNSNLTVSFPKVLTSTGVGLGFRATDGAPYLDEGTFVLAFNKAETFASNTSGETMESAFARLVIYVRSLGY